MRSKRFAILWPALIAALATGACRSATRTAPSAASATADQDWYQWRGPNRDGVSRETGWTSTWPADGPRRQWQVSVGYGLSSVSIRDGRLYTMGNNNGQDTIFCLDAESGQTLWTHKYPSRRLPLQFQGGPTATPSVVGGRVYTFSRAGIVHCLEAKTGRVVWSENLQKMTGAQRPNWGYSSSPLVHGDLIILNIGRSGVAVDAASGKLVWKSAPDKPGFSTPTPFRQDGRDAVAIFGSKALWAVRAADGKVLWQVPWPTNFGENISDPISVGDKLYFSSAHGRGAALLQLRDGDPRVIWKNEKFGNHVDTAVLWDGYLYGFDGRINRRGGSLNCVDFETGETQWTVPDFKGSLNLADGKLLILTLKGTLIIAEATPEAYKPIATAKVLDGQCWTPPVLCRGRLFCRSGEGDLLCLDLRKNAAGDN